ncbi:unnamed protein product [Clonostachys byssicola]|uniref:Choline monooxygenase, chloroplastic n=1 Tax=Clonostachys byssicola TaxID=160290 RepID=A0A9N9UPH0_9HYPO|nr:unnamed protein product [Clonostachys byssicola]
MTSTDAKPLTAPIKALPAPWYTSQAMFELEKRAIFSKRWLFTTHTSRVPKPGNWVLYQITDYNYVVAHERTGIKAYVCIDNGEATLNGATEGLEVSQIDVLFGFDFQAHLGKFRSAHVHVDRQAFVWVNLDQSEKPEFSWENDFEAIDRQPRHAAWYKPQSYVYDHTWVIEAHYNWKLAADNWNECYHCKTTHPDIPDMMDISSHSVEPNRAWMLHNSPPPASPEVAEENKKKGIGFFSSYCWPNVSITIAKNLIYNQRFIPVSPSKTIVTYEVFRVDGESVEDFNHHHVLIKRVMEEDKALCVAAQNNIERGVFVNGDLHPRLEIGSLYFQQLTREAVIEHVEIEDKVAHEIWPAGRATHNFKMVSGAASRDRLAAPSTQALPQVTS